MMKYNDKADLCGLKIECYGAYYKVNGLTYILAYETLDELLKMHQMGFKFINSNEFREWIQKDKKIELLTRFSQ